MAMSQPMAAQLLSVKSEGLWGASLFKQGQTLHRQGEGQLILPGGYCLLILINWRFVSSVNGLCSSFGVGLLGPAVMSQVQASSFFMGSPHYCLCKTN